MMSQSEGTWLMYLRGWEEAEVLTPLMNQDVSVSSLINIMSEATLEGNMVVFNIANLTANASS